MKRINISKKQIIIFVSLFSILFLCFGTSLGRFVYNEVKNVFFHSRKFYFESDKLEPELANYQIENWNGVDPHDIIINMNSMINNLTKADSDITYDISYTCSDNIICDSTKDTGIIYSSTNTDFFIVTLTPNRVLHTGDSVWIEVTTTSTDPYVKTLSGRFVLTVAHYGLSYEIIEDENDVYFDLDITNTLDYYNILTAFGSYNVGDRIDINTYLSLSDADKANCASAIVNLEFDPNVVLLDMTNTAYLHAISTETITMNGYQYINKISFKIDAVTSQIVKFYKVDPTQDYTYPLNGNPSVITVVFS